jgi:hypothetical protein
VVVADEALVRVPRRNAWLSKTRGPKRGSATRHSP